MLEGTGGSGGLATSRRHQLGGAASVVDTLPTSAVDGQGHTLLDVAMSLLNATAVGILANAGAGFDADARQRGRSSSSGGENDGRGISSSLRKMAVLHLQSLPGRKEESKLMAEMTMRMLELCVCNGVTPMGEERLVCTEIKNKSVGAEDRLIKCLEVTRERESKTVAFLYGRSKAWRRTSRSGREALPLLFWSEHGITSCWGSKCMEMPPSIETKMLRHCLSCGLQYCRSCVASDVLWNRNLIDTMAGDSLESCLCTACSMF
jgi:hypothetical protein